MTFGWPRKRQPHCSKHTLGTLLVDAGIPPPKPIQSPSRNESESEQKTNMVDANACGTLLVGVVLWFANSWTNWNGTFFRQERERT